MNKQEFDLDNLEVISEEEIKKRDIESGIKALEVVARQIEAGFYDAALRGVGEVIKHLDGTTYEMGRKVRSR